jgi:hypothetical protein
MRFAEFQAGQVIEAGPAHLGEEVLQFANAYDPGGFATIPKPLREGVSVA